MLPNNVNVTLPRTSSELLDSNQNFTLMFIVNTHMRVANRFSNVHSLFFHLSIHLSVLVNESFVFVCVHLFFCVRLDYPFVKRFAIEHIYVIHTTNQVRIKVVPNKRSLSKNFIKFSNINTPSQPRKANVIWFFLGARCNFHQFIRQCKSSLHRIINN